MHVVAAEPLSRVAYGATYLLRHHAAAKHSSNLLSVLAV